MRGTNTDGCGWGARADNAFALTHDCVTTPLTLPRCFIARRTPTQAEDAKLRPGVADDAITDQPEAKECMVCMAAPREVRYACGQYVARRHPPPSGRIAHRLPLVLHPYSLVLHPYSLVLHPYSLVLHPPSLILHRPPLVLRSSPIH